MQRSVPTIETVAALDHTVSSYLKTGDHLALLLDFDGTLAPVTDHPSNTYMQARTRACLERLAAHPRVHLAVISGRSRADVQSRVGIDRCTYSGNHGLEIRTPDGSDWLYEIPEQFQRNFERLVQVMDERMTREGAWVENKRASLTFHYREAPEERHGALHAEAREIVESLGFVVCEAHCAIEAKPPVRWNKGDAALRILRSRWGEQWQREVRVIFAGDDRTDEDAMRALQGQALSFRVAPDAGVLTYGDFRLHKQLMVTEMLECVEAAL